MKTKKNILMLSLVILILFSGYGTYELGKRQGMKTITLHKQNAK